MWQVLADLAKDNAFVVVKSAAVDAALARERITVGGRTEVKLQALPLANPSLEKEQFFLEFFSNVAEAELDGGDRHVRQLEGVPAGGDVHFSVQLTNKATQPRSSRALMPYQTHKMFTLSGTEGKARRSSRSCRPALAHAGGQVHLAAAPAGDLQAHDALQLLELVRRRAIRACNSARNSGGANRRAIL